MAKKPERNLRAAQIFLPDLEPNLLYVYLYGKKPEIAKKLRQNLYVLSSGHCSRFLFLKLDGRSNCGILLDHRDI
jgi:hypothetical protein